MQAADFVFSSLLSLKPVPDTEQVHKNISWMNERVIV